jgi:NADP-dependent 3-hydroxy acid dehydrogenase YdfG
VCVCVCVCVFVAHSQLTHTHMHFRGQGQPKCIVITGGSSGLGEGLALEYAAPGVTLGLTGRNEARLNGVKAACEKLGATVIVGE